MRVVGATLLVAGGITLGIGSGTDNPARMIVGFAVIVVGTVMVMAAR